MVATVFTVLIIVVPLVNPYREYSFGSSQVSAKGEEVWVVDTMQSIFRLNGGVLENIPGWATNVGASPDGWTWVISVSFSIQRWNPLKRIWDVMPGLGYQVNAISKDVAVVVGVDHAIYMWKGNGWTKIGERAIWVAIGETEEVWAVNRYDGSLWQWRYPWLGLGGWMLMDHPGAALQIDLQNSTRIIYRTEDQVYTRDGNNWKLHGALSATAEGFIGSVSINKNRMAVIGNLWRLSHD